MDVKGVIRQLIPQPTRTDAPQKPTTTVETSDRDANGQSPNQGDESDRHLTKEQIIEAVKYLESLEGVKDNGLKIRVETKDEVTVVYIEDRDGKIVRRIPTSELSLLNRDRNRKSGHLLNKAG
jgi:uncharacterized FlaG/YvyC family protein